MKVFGEKRKGGFYLNSVTEDPKFVTTEFGTKITSEHDIDTGGVHEESDEVDANADVVESIIGQFGWFQFRNVILMGMTGIVFSWINFANKFLTYEVDFWCAKPMEFANLTTEEWRNLSAPILESGKFDQCHIFNVNYSGYDELVRPDEDTATLACQSWEFANEPFTNTVTQRWSMVCDRDVYYKTLSQSIFFIGHFAGALSAGLLADWFGRKRAFLMILIPAIAFFLTSRYIDYPYGWMVMRFFVGLVNMAATTIKSVYMVEWTSGKWRSFSQHYFGEPFFLLSQMSMALIVWLIPDMKDLELILSFALLPYLSFVFLIEESPRWLLSKGYVDRAREVLAKALKTNNLPLSRLKKLDNYSFGVSNDGTPSKKQKQAFYTDLFKYPALRRNMICMAFVWFCFTMGYYGLIYNTPSFGWNLYITFAMPSFFNLAILTIQPHAENYIGRKPLLTGLMMLSGTLLLCTLTIPDGKFEHNWPIMVFAWIGTVACNSAFGVGYVFTKDLFPTTHRTIALSIASSCARLGAIASPYVAMLQQINPIFGLAAYGVFILFGGVVSVWVWPETKKTSNPETLEEAEEMASTPNPWLFWHRKH